MTLVGNVHTTMRLDISTCLGCIEFTREEQGKLVNLLINDAVDGDMINLLNERAKKLAEEKADILVKIDVLENEEREIINVINLSKKWRTADFEERKAVCNILIHKILINTDGNCEIIWNI